MNYRVNTARRHDSIGWALATLMVVVLAPTLAMAQFSIIDVQFYHPDTNAILVESDRMKYFNNSRCECGETIVVEVESVKDPSNTEDRLTIVAGRACLDSNGKIDETECNIIYPATDVSQIDAAIEIQPTVAQLMPKGCDSEESHDVIVYVGNTSEWTEAFTLGYRADGKPPSQPAKDKDPVAGEGLATVYFVAGSQGNETDIKYQILCEKELDGEPGPIPWSATKVFDRSFMAPCEGGSTGSGDAGVEASDGSTSSDATADNGTIADAGIDAASPDDSALLQDERFVCSDAQTGDGKVTIKGLELDVTYRFWAVSFDDAQNVADPVSLGTATPGLTEDLWERYKRSGGAAKGGYCALSAPASPTWPLMALALLLAVGLARSAASRRRGGRRK